jgi:hypothetical protein
MFATGLWESSVIILIHIERNKACIETKEARKPTLLTTTQIIPCFLILHLQVQSVIYCFIL